MTFPTFEQFFDASVNPQNQMTTVKDKALLEVMDNSAINDDAGLFLAQQLTYIKAKGYDVIHPLLKYKEAFAPSDEVIPAFQNSFAIKIFDHKGKASRGSLEGETNQAEPTLVGTLTGNVTYSKAYYAYTTEELEQAAMLRTNLSQRKVDTCFQTIERDINEMAFFGDKALAVKGFLDETQGLTPVTVPAWTDATTPEEIIASVVDMGKSVFEAGQIDPFDGGYTFWLDKVNYERLRMPINFGGFTISIREYLERDYNLTVGWLPEFGEGVAAKHGVTIPATSKIMALIPNDNESIFRQDAGTFEQRAPQADAFKYSVHMYKKFGGVVVTKPARVGLFYQPKA